MNWQNKVEELRSKLANVAVSDDSTQKVEKDYLKKLNVLEDKVRISETSVYRFHYTIA